MWSRRIINTLYYYDYYDDYDDYDYYDDDDDDQATDQLDPAFHRFPCRA